MRKQAVPRLWLFTKEPLLCKFTGVKGLPHTAKVAVLPSQASHALR